MNNQQFNMQNDNYDQNADQEIQEEITGYEDDNFLPEDHDSQSEYYEVNGILTKSMPNAPNFRNQYNPMGNPSSGYDQNQQVDPRNFQRLGQSVNLGAGGGRMQQLNQQDYIPQRQTNQNQRHTREGAPSSTGTTTAPAGQQRSGSRGMPQIL